MIFRNENPNLGPTTTVNDTVFGDVKPQVVEPMVVGPYAAASATGEWLLISAAEAMQVTAISCNFTVTSSSGTVAVRKITADAVAPDATAGANCIELLTAAMSASGTANTKVVGTLSTVSGAVTLAKGDRIGIKLAGTLTGLVGLMVEVDAIRI